VEKLTMHDPEPLSLAKARARKGVPAARRVLDAAYELDGKVCPLTDDEIAMLNEAADAWVIKRQQQQARATGRE
jgi:hypothetical protein